MTVKRKTWRRAHLERIGLLYPTCSGCRKRVARKGEVCNATCALKASRIRLP